MYGRYAGFPILPIEAWQRGTFCMMKLWEEVGSSAWLGITVPEWVSQSWHMLMLRTGI